MSLLKLSNYTSSLGFGHILPEGLSILMLSKTDGVVKYIIAMLNYV